MKKKKLFLILIIFVIIFFSFLFIYNRSIKKQEVTSSQSIAQIGYLENQIIYQFDNGKKFNNDNPIIISWDIDEVGTMIYPNKIQKSFNKGNSVSEVGTYTIKVGKTSKNFEIIEDNINRYITFDSSSNSIKINNLNDIINIKIGNETFDKESQNIPSNYKFTAKGMYNIILKTITGKILSNTYRIQ